MLKKDPVPSGRDDEQCCKPSHSIPIPKVAIRGNLAPVNVTVSVQTGTFVVNELTASDKTAELWA